MAMVKRNESWRDPTGYRRGTEYFGKVKTA
jgi:hypothetical protein